MSYDGLKFGQKDVDELKEAMEYAKIAGLETFNFRGDLWKVKNAKIVIDHLEQKYG